MESMFVKLNIYILALDSVKLMYAKRPNFKMDKISEIKLNINFLIFHAILK